MKKYLIYLLCLHIKLSYGQNCIGTNSTNEYPCCNQIINIDPLDNTYIVNTERIGLNNHRDINFQNFDVKYLDPNHSLKAINAQNIETYLNNPIFELGNEYDMMTNWKQFYDVDKLPMHPKNGWQLMHHYDGWKPFTRFNSAVNMTSLSAGKLGYHYMYYNKYTGDARFVIYPQTDGPYNPSELSLNLRLVKNASPKPDASAIFNIYNERLVGLDKPTLVDEVKSYLGSKQNVGSINGAFLDFRFYYDPCVCITKPILEFEARQRTTLQLYAEGKYAGITRQFDKSGKIPSNYGENWLGSVYGDYNGSADFEVKNGFQIYRTADSMAKQFYVSPELQTIASALGMFGKVASGSFNIPTNYTLANTLGKLTNIPSLLNDTNKLNIPLGNLLSGGINYLAGQINADVPNVSFSEGQIAMRGKIVGDTKWPGFNTRSIIYPGSYNVYNKAGVGEYPYYNENVGVFSLIYTPKLWYRTKSNYGKLYTDFSIQNPLKYAINPRADVDLLKTKIYSTIEFDYYLPYTDTIKTNQNANSTIFNFDQAIYDLFSPSKGFAVVHKVRINVDSLNSNLPNGIKIYPFSGDVYNSKSLFFNDKYLTRYTIQTILLPIDKIHEFEFKFDLNFNNNQEQFLIKHLSNIYFGGPLHPNTPLNTETSGNLLQKLQYSIFMSPRIKIIGHYNYFPNRFQTPPEWEQILTYDIDNGIQVNKTAITSQITPNVIRTSQFNFSSTNNTITAQTIIVDSDLSGYNFPIYLNGIVSIDVVNGGTVSPTTTIQIIQDPLGHVSLNPFTESEIKSFCSTNNYSAKNFLKNARIKDFITKNKSNVASISLHPNPTSSKTTLTLSGYEHTNVSVMIFDLIGREVYTQLEKDITAREHQAVLNTEMLQAGTYIVKIFNGREEKVAKLVILKN
jgi:hypothetical protein